MLREILAAWLLMATLHAASAADYIWGPDKRGLQAGARLISATGTLQVGDPVVVEFVLKNTSGEKKTVVIQQYDNTYPTMGGDNRIELNILGSSQRRWQHELEPDQVLKKRQYRVSFSTEGLPPANYQVTGSIAFWISFQPNRGTGVPHSRPIPVTIGDPDSFQLSQPPQLDGKQKIYWGGQVAGLIAGMRFPEGKDSFKNDDCVEAQMFLYNATTEDIELRYQIPAVASDWNLHLTHESNQYVRLDSTWFSGAVPKITRRVTIKSGAHEPITGINGLVSSGGSEPVERMIDGPAIQLLAETVEFQHGDPKRLISGKGKYIFHAAITIEREEIPDLSMVLSAGGIPFEVNPDAE